MKAVELHPNYFFDCDDCGLEVQVRPVVVTLEKVLEDERSQGADEEEVMMLKDFFESEGGSFSDKPESVTCPHCDSTFEVVED